MSEVSERFGALIRESRLALDPPMTQKDLARCVKVHQPSVSAWELGKTLPSPGTMIELVKLFNLDLSNLPHQRKPEGASEDTAEQGEPADVQVEV